MGDLGSLLKQAQVMHAELDRVNGELETREVEGTAGGRAVVVRLTATLRVLGVGIDPAFHAEATREELEELVHLATKDALERAQAIAREERERVTGGMNLPGLL